LSSGNFADWRRRRPAWALGIGLLVVLMHLAAVQGLAVLSQQTAFDIAPIQRLQVVMLQDLRPQGGEVATAPRHLVTAKPSGLIIVPLATAAAASAPLGPPAVAPPSQADTGESVSDHEQVAVATSSEAAEALPAMVSSPPAAPELSAADTASIGASRDTAGAVDAPVTFEWPPSTRIAYSVTGHFQGPVHGQAQVEWLREGERYQVHLDVSVGPRLAPFVQRRMSSEGLLTAQGLRPQRYEEETRVVLREPRRSRMTFADDQVTLANGNRAASLPGLQDTASQFVQLTWLFTTQPQRLRVGERIELPLALPRRVGTWVYEVVAQERLATLAGELPVLHLRPAPGSGRPGELVAEAWFAPDLQYLPVRILIRQDEQTHIDLLLSEWPKQAQILR
jgi:hypothetical protein